MRGFSVGAVVVENELGRQILGDAMALGGYSVPIGFPRRFLAG